MDLWVAAKAGAAVWLLNTMLVLPQVSSIVAKILGPVASEFTGLFEKSKEGKKYDPAGAAALSDLIYLRSATTAYGVASSVLVVGLAVSGSLLTQLLMQCA